MENISKENVIPIEDQNTLKMDILNNDKIMYDDLSFEIKYMNKNLRNIGESHVSNCDTSTNNFEMYQW